MTREILHCDCNSFFASVESATHPEYKNVPMAVGGDETQRHGIILAKNDLAKKYGVTTAETIHSAKKKCPQLLIVPPHYEEYVKYSKAVNAIYAKYTDMIEPFGIDESWLDVTASQRLFGDGEKIANLIREEVKRELGITISVGVSFNKVFAKLGSDYKKPDAVTVISPENYKEIVFPLKVSDMLFVGKKTANALTSMGIRTIGELANTSVLLLTRRFGKMGEMLHRYASGEDDSPVVKESDDAKSVSSGFTFRHDLTTLEECRVGIDYLSEDIGQRLRRQGQVAETVSISIKDTYFRTVQRQAPLAMPTDVAKEIAEGAYSIFASSWSDGRPIRTLTVSVTHLTRKSDSATQISLFGEEEETKHLKNEKIEKALDKIRQKYGNSSIVNAGIIESDIGVFEKKRKKGL